jgi:putative DNA methylase
MAIVAEGERGRVYLAPTPEHEEIARQAKPEWRPEGDVPARLTGGTCVPYGLKTWADLFTPRQLVALTTFSDLVGEAMTRVKRDAEQVIGDGLWGIGPDGKSPNPNHLSPIPLSEGGTGATAYAEAVGVYLALGVGRSANYWSSLTPWGGDFIVQTFGRQAIPMVWDHAEGNPLSASTGNWTAALEWIEKVMVTAFPAWQNGRATQGNAQTQTISRDKVISTDPPYYDNIGYADLSDFFYVWLRRSLRSVFPDLFATLAVPKAEELVATPYRHGSKEKAEAFFLDGMTQAMHRLAEQAHPAFPVTIFYAFKQSETETGEGTASTGWETFLDAVIRSGFAVTGTWPMRTERDQGLKTGTNVLASSIILVCRPRPVNAPTATRREFVQTLKAELPPALAELQKANIAPVDLAQAAIGPGMAVYTRYAKVLDAEGKPLTVREALALINATLDEALAEQEGDFDADSRWALAWFEQHGFAEGEFGVAETLSKAKNTSVAGMVEAGIVASARGKVRLLRPDELPADWDPALDARLTAWETVHQLIRALESGGEAAAASLVAKLGAKAEVARELAYRLYTLSERKKRAAEALSYNALVQSWPEIARLARETAQYPSAPAQADLL